jgi:antitoxin component HigA of HigAB toxin-antitoxin module
MPDIPRDIADDGTEDDTEQAVERIAAEVLDDIEHGRVEGDTASILSQRLEAEGILLRSEAIDSIAEDIEEEASR